MDPLAKIFGSANRLKLLRLFLFNDDTAFALPDAAMRAKINVAATRKELNTLVAADVLKKRKSGKITTYQANQRFEHREALLMFLRSTTSVKDTHIIDWFRKAGTLRAIVLSGIFTGSLESKIDLLIVGDRLEERAIKSAVHDIEAELGRELRYAAFTTPDFRYRLGVYDRLIRDVMDYSHRTILDKLGL
ncbi:MAG: hypothetical protein WAV21_02285 [Minisyncoccia bacterium]